MPIEDVAEVIDIFDSDDDQQNLSMPQPDLPMAPSEISEEPFIRRNSRRGVVPIMDEEPSSEASQDSDSDFRHIDEFNDADDNDDADDDNADDNDDPEEDQDLGMNEFNLDDGF